MNKGLIIIVTLILLFSVITLNSANKAANDIKDLNAKRLEQLNEL